MRLKYHEFGFDQPFGGHSEFCENKLDAGEQLLYNSLTGGLFDRLVTITGCYVYEIKRLSVNENRLDPINRLWV